MQFGGGTGQRLVVFGLITSLLVSSILVLPSTESGFVEDDPSAADGLDWVKLGLSLDVGPPGSLDDDRVTTPSVVFRNNIFMLWYSGSDGSIWRIFHATSVNGFSWDKKGAVLGPGPSGSWDDRYPFFPCVLYEDGEYKMWYTGERKSWPGWRVMHATSADGLNWVRHGLVLDTGPPGSLDDNGVAHPSVLREIDGTYSMWYSAHDGVSYRIMKATSPDGISWTRQGIALDAGPPGSGEDYQILAPSVLISRSGTYQMYYSGSPSSSPLNTMIFYAESPNGVGQSFVRGGMVLDLGQPGDWDSVQLLGPRVVRESRFIYKMWYTSYNGATRRVLMAMAGELPSVTAVNLTTSVVNDKDILVNWTDPDLPFLDHYLIYRSTDQRSFDFSMWHHNTSNDPNPLASSWIDVDAALPGSPPELYYVVRAFYSFGGFSTTSNTAGKWTMAFQEGMTSFSLPLEPFVDRNISWFVQQIPGLQHMAWLGPDQRWVVHYNSMAEGTNDILAEFGAGFEMFFDYDSHFTFCGMPGSMIKFKEGLGESSDWARSLTAEYRNDQVTLRWDQVPGAVEYDIFKASTREGLHRLNIVPFAGTFGVGEWTDTDPFKCSSDSYYMVVAVNASGVGGSSTYSVGVEMLALTGGSHSIGLELEPQETVDLREFCLNHTDVEGVSYSVAGVWKFHSWSMPSGAYNPDMTQGFGYQISVRCNHSIVVVEIGY